MKTCSKCNVEKDETEFCKSSRGKDNLSPQCKSCTREYQAKWREGHLEKSKEYKKKYYTEHSETVKEGNKKWRERNAEKVKGYGKKWRDSNPDDVKMRNSRYRKENKDRIKKYRHDYRRANPNKDKEYREKTKDHIKAWHRANYIANREAILRRNREYLKYRKANDPVFAAKRRLRTSVYLALARKRLFKKQRRTFTIIGCSISELMLKWGIDKIPEGYHIDHIVPMSQAVTAEEAEKLCHWSNLQILTAEDNMRKSDSRNEENEALCLKILGREWID